MARPIYKADDKNSERSSAGLERIQARLFRAVMILGVLTMLVVAVMPWIGKPGDAGEWLSFLGLFHPLFLHLPIGVVIAVLVMEFAGLVTGGRYRGGTTLALFIAVVTGFFALVLGYFLYLSGDFSGELVEAHKKTGIIFTLLLIATFMVKYSADVFSSKGFLRVIYLLMLLATTGVMIKTGHHGGEMTHGDPLDEAPWKKEPPVARKEAPEKSDPEVPEPAMFEAVVMPILEAKCIQCHGEKKQRSELRLDSYAAILAGGEIQADDFGTVLIPGDTEKSTLISYLYLPEDDDLRMPPEGKKQLTPEEIAALAFWVKSGASETASSRELGYSPEAP